MVGVTQFRFVSGTNAGHTRERSVPASKMYARLIAARNSFFGRDSRLSWSTNGLFDELWRRGWCYFGFPIATFSNA